MNVTWATRIGANAVNSPSRGKNLNRAKYLSENNNNEYSYDSLTAVKNGQVDNEEHMSVSQVILNPFFKKNGFIFNVHNIIFRYNIFYKQLYQHW